MVLLAQAVVTTSYKSWHDIAGSEGVFVQQRTPEGLKKNKSAAHRLITSWDDLAPYRIVIICSTKSTAIERALKEAASEPEQQLRLSAFSSSCSPDPVSADTSLPSLEHSKAPDIATVSRADMSVTVSKNQFSLPPYVAIRHAPSGGDSPRRCKRRQLEYGGTLRAPDL